MYNCLNPPKDILLRNKKINEHYPRYRSLLFLLVGRIAVLDLPDCNYMAVHEIYI
jgi:hypothetical protein